MQSITYIINVSFMQCARGELVWCSVISLFARLPVSVAFVSYYVHVV